MARGGYGAGSGIPLGERVRVGASAGAAAPAASAAPAQEDPQPSASDCPARHCWVTVPVDGPHPRPGLLWEWRRVERGRYEGLVSYPARLRTGRWAAVTEWVPSELLAPL